MNSLNGAISYEVCLSARPGDGGSVTYGASINSGLQNLVSGAEVYAFIAFRSIQSA